MLIYIYQGLELLGVVLATCASMFIGMLWYSTSFFGTEWMKLVGMNTDMKAHAKKNARMSYIFMTLSAFIMMYVLGLFIKNMFVPTILQALEVGFFAWLGFVATTGVSEYLFNATPKPWKLYLINNGYQLVNLIVGSVILFIFMR